MSQTARELTPELIELCKALGNEMGVTPAIHESDYIFWFIFASATDKNRAVHDYFDGGAATAVWLRNIIGEIRPLDQPFSILDFASGYGRVARHLGKAFPNARVIASDIHPAAVNFMNANGTEAVPSSSIPEEFDPKQKFDVVVAISFFTHMPQRTWVRWLRSLLCCLNPGGILIFTTHGEPGLAIMSKALDRELAFDDDGFWFTPSSEQADLDNAEYGSTATSFHHVYSQAKNLGAKLLRFQEAGTGYQDLYIIQNVSSPHAANVLAKGVEHIENSDRHVWIDVNVTNMGSASWINSTDRNDFLLGGRLYASSAPTQTPVREFRAFLPQRVKPGQSASVSLLLNMADLPPSKYILLVDVVKEGDFWFEDRGGACLVMEVDLPPDSSPVFSSLPSNEPRAAL